MLIQKTIPPSLLDLSDGEASPDRNENPCLGDLPFCSSGGKERPKEAPLPTTATANAQAGLKRIAGFSS